MSNVLSFALGIETATFEKGMGSANKALLTLIGTFSLASVSASKFERIMAGGSKLFEDSFQINETVKRLYQLENAFVAVGLPAEEAVNMQFKLERALSGVSEAGQRTEATFAQLGLNIRDLQQMNPAEQFLAVANALGHVNAAAAPGLASNLFGRFGAGPALQIARQSAAFNQGFSGGARDGNIFQQMAGPLQRLRTTWDEIGREMDAAWANAMKGFIRPMQGLMDSIKAFDWETLGENIGKAIAGLIGAFQSGKLSELIGETLHVGFEMGMVLIMPVLERLGIELLNIFGHVGVVIFQTLSSPLEKVQARMQWMAEKVMEYDAKTMSPALLDFVYGGQVQKGFKASSYEEILKENNGSLQLFNTSLSEMHNLLTANASAARDFNNKDLAESKKKLSAIFGGSGLWLEYLKYGSKVPKPDPDGGGGGGGGFFDSNNEARFKPSANAFEKIGAVFHTARGSVDDYARRTAVGIEELVSMGRRGGYTWQGVNRP